MKRIAIVAVILSAAAPAAAQQDAAEVFAPLLGSCYSAAFPRTEAVNVQCFESLAGGFVRNRHAVFAPARVYEGETLYHRDAETGRILFRYFSGAGGAGDGPGDWDAVNGILSVEQRHVRADGRVEYFRGRFHDMDSGGFSAVNERLRDGEWVEVARMRYRYAGPAPGMADIPPPESAE